VLLSIYLTEVDESMILGEARRGGVVWFVGGLLCGGRRNRDRLDMR